MRRHVFMCAAALLGALSAMRASAETLWQNTSSGMSPSDVAKLYPDTAPTTLNGHQALRKTTPVIIFGVPFQVIFFFDDAKLYEVSMQASDPGDKSVLKDPLVTYGLVADELVKRYGRPVRVSRSSVIASESQYFLKEGTSIELGYTDLGSLGASTKGTFVSVKYSAPTGGENPL